MTILRNREVDLLKEAKKFNADVYFGDVDESGNVQKVGDNQYEIYIKKFDAKERQRFTIAHELGHIKLHPEDVERAEGDGIGIGHRGINSLTKEKEAQANDFAANLLMPYELLIEALEEIGKDITKVLSYSDIQRLAESFGVSRQSMGWRLYNLDYIVDGKVMY